MSRFLEAAAALAVLMSSTTPQAHAQTPVPSPSAYAGIGRTATPAEVKAWDIDVRPDFKGLPKGSGSVTKGQDVWEAKCASCHGVFGEANQVFSPLVGGTTADDIKTGRVANLTRSDYPGRTTLMKVPTLSTLWDYINRAMPWNQPKSLTTEEVYAVTAYVLNLGGIVPDDFTLSDANIAEVQQRMPNRNGMQVEHAMWPGDGLGSVRKPDTAAKPCMSNCAPDSKVASMLPDFARNAHGNLAEQNREVGAQRGAMTAPKSESPKADAAKSAVGATAPGKPTDAVNALLQTHSCTACHAASQKLVGPSWADIAKKQAGKADYLAQKIRAGGSGAWGEIPMPPQSLPDAELRQIAEWLSKPAAP